MKQAKKVKQALQRRIAVWENIPSGGMHGANVKVVKDPNGMAYHKPGSQNMRKGRSGRKANR